MLKKESFFQYLFVQSIGYTNNKPSHLEYGRNIIAPPHLKRNYHNNIKNMTKDWSDSEITSGNIAGSIELKNAELRLGNSDKLRALKLKKVKSQTYLLLFSKNKKIKNKCAELRSYYQLKLKTKKIQNHLFKPTNANEWSTFRELHNQSKKNSINNSGAASEADKNKTTNENKQSFTEQGEKTIVNQNNLRVETPPAKQILEKMCLPTSHALRASEIFRKTKKIKETAAIGKNFKMTQPSQVEQNLLENTNNKLWVVPSTATTNGPAQHIFTRAERGNKTLNKIYVSKSETPFSGAPLLFKNNEKDASITSLMIGGQTAKKAKQLANNLPWTNQHHTLLFGELLGHSVENLTFSSGPQQSRGSTERSFAPYQFIGSAERHNQPFLFAGGKLPLRGQKGDGVATGAIYNIFLTYKKSFLSYWLLPLMGIISLTTVPPRLLSKQLMPTFILSQNKSIMSGASLSDTGDYSTNLKQKNDTNIGVRMKDGLSDHFYRADREFIGGAHFVDCNGRIDQSPIPQSYEYKSNLLINPLKNVSKVTHTKKDFLFDNTWVIAANIKEVSSTNLINTYPLSPQMCGAPLKIASKNEYWFSLHSSSINQKDKVFKPEMLKTLFFKLFKFKYLKNGAKPTSFIKTAYKNELQGILKTQTKGPLLSNWLLPSEINFGDLNYEILKNNLTKRNQSKLNWYDFLLNKTINNMSGAPLNITKPDLYQRAELVGAPPFLSELRLFYFPNKILAPLPKPDLKNNWVNSVANVRSSAGEAPTSSVQKLKINNWLGVQPAYKGYKRLALNPFEIYTLSSSKNPLQNKTSKIFKKWALDDTPVPPVYLSGAPLNGNLIGISNLAIKKAKKSSETVNRAELRSRDFIFNSRVLTNGANIKGVGSANFFKKSSLAKPTTWATLADIKKNDLWTANNPANKRSFKKMLLAQSIIARPTLTKIQTRFSESKQIKNRIFKKQKYFYTHNHKSIMLHKKEEKQTPDLALKKASFLLDYLLLKNFSVNTLIINLLKTDSQYYDYNEPSSALQSSAEWGHNPLSQTAGNILIKESPNLVNNTSEIMKNATMLNETIVFILKNKKATQTLLDASRASKHERSQYKRSELHKKPNLFFNGWLKPWTLKSKQTSTTTNGVEANQNVTYPSINNRNILYSCIFEGLTDSFNNIIERSSVQASFFEKIGCYRDSLKSSIIKLKKPILGGAELVGASPAGLRTTAQYYWADRPSYYPSNINNKKSTDQATANNKKKLTISNISINLMTPKPLSMYKDKNKKTNTALSIWRLPLKLKKSQTLKQLFILPEAKNLENNKKAYTGKRLAFRLTTKELCSDNEVSGKANGLPEKLRSSQNENSHSKNGFSLKPKNSLSGASLLFISQYLKMLSNQIKQEFNPYKNRIGQSYLWGGDINTSLYHQEKAYNNIDTGSMSVYSGWPSVNRESASNQLLRKNKPGGEKPSLYYAIQPKKRKSVAFSGAENFEKTFLSYLSQSKLGAPIQKTNTPQNKNERSPLLYKRLHFLNIKRKSTKKPLDISLKIGGAPLKKLIQKQLLIGNRKSNGFFEKIKTRTNKSMGSFTTNFAKTNMRNRMSFLMLIKNRLFINKKSVANTEYWGALPKCGPLDHTSTGGGEHSHTLKVKNTTENENIIKETRRKKQQLKLKRRLKKMQCATRRRKKRKIFYPRPKWLTFKMYNNFLNSRFISKQKNKQNISYWELNSQLQNSDVFKKHKSLGVLRTPKTSVVQEAALGHVTIEESINSKASSFFIDSPNASIKAAHEVGSTLYINLTKISGASLNNYKNSINIDPKMLVDIRRLPNSSIKNWQNWNNPVKPIYSKDFYKIAPAVSRDLRRILLKSNWLRNYLNPYLDKIKYIYKEIEKYEKNMDFFFKMRSFMKSFYGSAFNEAISAAAPWGASKNSIHNILTKSRYARLIDARNVVEQLTNPFENLNLAAPPVQPVPKSSKKHKNQRSSTERSFAQSSSDIPTITNEINSNNTQQSSTFVIKPIDSNIDQSYKNGLIAQPSKSAMKQLKQNHSADWPHKNGPQPHSILNFEYNRIIYQRIQRLILNMCDKAYVLCVCLISR
jgi:hypothetical protein